MSNETHIQGHQNIVIQGVTDSTLTLSINGEAQEIRNELTALRELLESRSAQTVQYADKIYNIEHIDEANFGAVTQRIIFNGILVKRLIKTLQHKPEVQDFLRTLPPESENNWEETPEFLRDAQSVVGQNFVWVLAWELRRLFAIGGDKRKRQEEKVEEYIHHCFSAAKMTIQLANFLLIAELWDKKKQGETLTLNTAHLEPFFGTRPLTVSEHFQLLSNLVQMFADNDIDLYIVPKTVLDKDAEIAIAINRLETLASLGTTYGLGHCHTAEACLADLLTALPFFTQHRLVTIKRVEYESARNKSPRYIKDFTILEKKEAREWQRMLKFDTTPTQSYALLLHSSQQAFNLFPFLLDYHALINEQVFQIQLYECREGWNGLRYYNVEQEKSKSIYYCDTDEQVVEVKTEDEKKGLERDVRFDLTIQQLEDAMNTLLGTNHRFVKEASRTEDQYGNI
jgi:hypothetical protein